MATKWEHALAAARSIGTALGVKVEESIISVENGTAKEISIGKFYSVRYDEHTFFWRIFKVDKNKKESLVGSCRSWSNAVYSAFDEMLDEIINGCLAMELEAEKMD